MESSPKPASPVTQVTSTASLPRPTLLRNLGFWLLAIVVGALLILPGGVALSSGKDNFIYMLLAAGMAAVLSLAALPLLLPLLPWALTAPSVATRWLRVFTLQSLSLGGLSALSYVLFSGDKLFGAMAALAGTACFAGGLLAAALVYRPWLRPR